MEIMPAELFEKLNRHDLHYSMPGKVVCHTDAFPDHLPRFKTTSLSS